MSQVSREQLIGMLETTVERLGFELADLELLEGTHGLLRLFIDNEAGFSL